MIRKIAVLGSGTMGHGIAESFAMYGYEVNLYDTDEKRLTIAKQDIKQELEMMAEEAFIAQELIGPTLARIKLCTDLKATVSDRDYVIEAVPEILDLKQKLFRQLDEYCPEHTILASNTSSLKLNAMMALVSEKRKQRMMVNHWYNPAHLMPIVELSCFGNMPEVDFRRSHGTFRHDQEADGEGAERCPGPGGQQDSAGSRQRGVFDYRTGHRHAGGCRQGAEIRSGLSLRHHRAAGGRRFRRTGYLVRCG